jgi:hypothetical protein
MRYFTLQQIADHTGKHRESVRLALKAAQIVPERFPGCRGGRIPERTANAFVSKWQPAAGPLPVNSVQQSAQPVNN